MYCQNPKSKIGNCSYFQSNFSIQNKIKILFCWVFNCLQDGKDLKLILILETLFSHLKRYLDIVTLIE